jgi:hypothetical protein
MYSITASAVCLFDMNQLMGAFGGKYKAKTSLSPASASSSLSDPGTSTINSREQDNIPKPRPNECPDRLTYQHLVFSRKNVAMESEARSEAIVVETSTKSRFVSIDVDFNVRNRSSVTHHTDVLFVGTGRLNKL